MQEFKNITFEIGYDNKSCAFISIGGCEKHQTKITITKVNRHAYTYFIGNKYQLEFD